MNRLNNLDRLKAIAMFAVLVLHAPASDATTGVAWQLFNQFCRFAVPCFFLVSGFFFARSFSRAQSAERLMIRYESRLLVLFLFWAIFYAVVPPLGADPPYSTDTAAGHLSYIGHHPKSFFLSGYVLHLWFLSALMQGIGLLWLCLRCGSPWLALILGGALFAIALLGGPYAHAVGWKWVFDMKEGPFYSTLFVALGAAASFYKWRLNVLLAAGLAIAGLVIEWVEDWMMQDPARGVTIASHDFTFGTLPWALGIFFFALALSDRNEDAFSRIGVYTLGMYALHVYVIRLLFYVSIGQMLAGLPLILLGLGYLISLAATVALSRLPYVRRLVT